MRGGIGTSMPSDALGALLNYLTSARPANAVATDGALHNLQVFGHGQHRSPQQNPLAAIMPFEGGGSGMAGAPAGSGGASAQAAPAQLMLADASAAAPRPPAAPAPTADASDAAAVTVAATSAHVPADAAASAAGTGNESAGGSPLKRPAAAMDPASLVQLLEGVAAPAGARKRLTCKQDGKRDDTALAARKAKVADEALAATGKAKAAGKAKAKAKAAAAAKANAAAMAHRPAARKRPAAAGAPVAKGGPYGCPKCRWGGQLLPEVRTAHPSPQPRVVVE